MSLYNKELADGFAKVAEIKAPALGGMAKKPDVWSSVSEIPGLSDMWNGMNAGPAADTSTSRLESALDMVNKMDPGLRDRIGRDDDRAEWERGAPADVFADVY